MVFNLIDMTAWTGNVELIMNITWIPFVAPTV